MEFLLQRLASFSHNNSNKHQNELILFPLPLSLFKETVVTQTRSKPCLRTAAARSGIQATICSHWGDHGGTCQFWWHRHRGPIPSTMGLCAVSGLLKPGQHVQPHHSVVSLALAVAVHLACFSREGTLSSSLAMKELLKHEKPAATGV